MGNRQQRRLSRRLAKMAQGRYDGANHRLFETEILRVGGD